MRTPLLIGSRGSKLALVQAKIVADAFEQLGIQTKITPITTSGDRIKGALVDQGGKGLFVKEIEEALFASKIDLAVHSLKDLPAFLPPGLRLAGTVKREDPRDVVICRDGMSWQSLPAGARIGTSSPRRMFQLHRLRPDLVITPMRGNVETRLEKVRRGDFDAIVLAAAGLKRLNLVPREAYFFPPAEMIPAIGQGALALELREENCDLMAFIDEQIADRDSTIALRAERAFLQEIEGDCRTPVGGHAELDGDQLVLRGYLASPNGATAIVDEESGTTDEAGQVGRRLGERMRKGVKT